MALQARRWDLFDLLLQWGADLRSADVYTVLSTYNAELYERFRAAGYDLTAHHEMGSILGRGTSNRPLLGFVKRHRAEDPLLQRELNMALKNSEQPLLQQRLAISSWACEERQEKIRRAMLYPTELRARAEEVMCAK
jgi:hypothetical protein